MRRRLFLIGIAGAVLIGAVVAQARPRSGDLLPPAFIDTGDSAGVHLYGNPAVSAADIAVHVISFIPRENASDIRRSEESIAYFRDTLAPELSAFHRREFLDRSQIRFLVHDEPLVALRERAFYEEEFLEIEAMDPLRFIEQEIRSRIFAEEGDRYRPEFSMSRDSSFPLLLILYGAAVPEREFGGQVSFIAGLTGDLGVAALVFRPVVDPDLTTVFPNSGSIVYHELLHALGVPEQYDLRSPDVLVQQKARGDILGRGTLLPLPETFVGIDVKTAMGLRE